MGEQQKMPPVRGLQAVHKHNTAYSTHADTTLMASAINQSSSVSLPVTDGLVDLHLFNDSISQPASIATILKPNLVPTLSTSNAFSPFQ